MKRNCNNCKALVKDINNLGYKCGLGRKIEVTQEYDGVPVSYKPLEKCPKPKTYSDYCDWLSCDRFSNIR